MQNKQQNRKQITSRTIKTRVARDEEMSSSCTSWICHLALEFNHVGWTSSRFGTESGSLEDERPQRRRQPLTLDRAAAADVDTANNDGNRTRDDDASDSHCGSNPQNPSTSLFSREEDKPDAEIAREQERWRTHPRPADADDDDDSLFGQPPPRDECPVCLIRLPQIHEQVFALYRQDILTDILCLLYWKISINIGGRVNRLHLNHI